jgi:DNA invertase Pin-like site-specific DNA recombinase
LTLLFRNQLAQDEMCCNTTNVNNIQVRQCVVDLSTAYYNSSPQVTALLACIRDVISAAAATERHQSMPEVSELAAASRNGQPRAIRDRLDPDEYQQLLAAARAGVCKRALAEKYGISRRSIYRLMAA